MELKLHGGKDNVRGSRTCWGKRQFLYYRRRHIHHSETFRNPWISQYLTHDYEVLRQNVLMLIYWNSETFQKICETLLDIEKATGYGL